MNDFAGLVAAVTGGASGIGAAVARVLQDRGARVAVLDLDPSGVPDGVLGVRTDVSDDASVRAAVEQVVAELGRLDVVVNNAGVGAQGTVADNDDEEWHRVLDVNVLGLSCRGSRTRPRRARARPSSARRRAARRPRR